MEKGVNHDRIAAWRWVASILIYPVTVLPGLNATVLLISSVCVGLDSWSLEGALSNMSLGFPWRHSGSCGLCDSSHTGRQRHAVVGIVREIRQPGGSCVIVSTKVSHSIPYFRSFCRSVARWMPICKAALARLPWFRRRSD